MTGHGIVVRALGSVTLAISVLYAGTLTAADDTEKMVLRNHCLDEAQNRNWERLRVEHAEHPGWQRLYRARTRICGEIERGEASLSSGIVEFESIRREVIEQEKARVRDARKDAEAG